MAVGLQEHCTRIVMVEVPVEHPSLTVSVVTKSPAFENCTVLCSHLLVSLFVLTQLPKVTPALLSLGATTHEALVMVNTLFQACGMLNLKALDAVPSNNSWVFWKTL